MLIVIAAAAILLTLSAAVGPARSLTRKRAALERRQN